MPITLTVQVSSTTQGEEDNTHIAKQSQGTVAYCYIAFEYSQTEHMTLDMPAMNEQHRLM